MTSLKDMRSFYCSGNLSQVYKDETSRMTGDNITYVGLISGEAVRVVLNGDGIECCKIEQEYKEWDK